MPASRTASAATLAAVALTAGLLTAAPAGAEHWVLTVQSSRSLGWFS
ncbi:hypothetical protein [Mycolicibacterium insubricum]|nr:hypothetical protein [Mycolicibacterium insubricum]